MSGTRMRLADVAQLDPGITPEELQEQYGDDPDTISLLTVAEATLNRVPSGLSRWLVSEEVCDVWEDVLTRQEGLHQLSWWNSVLGSGFDDPATRRAERRLARIRQRGVEARLIVEARAGLSADRATASALAALMADHREEAEPLFHPKRNDDVARLLTMGAVAFRELVGNDIKDSGVCHALRHPALLSRWYEALVAIGTMAFTEIGLEVTPARVRNLFAVPDPHLIQARHDTPRERWASKLTFLTHVRAALVEHDRLSRRADAPLHRHLIERHPVRYAELVEQARQDPRNHRPPPRPPHPSVFDGHADVLREHGWDVRWIFDGHRVWLDAWPIGERTGRPSLPAWRTGGRLIATAVRNRNTGRSAWRWSAPTYVFYGRGQGRYTLLTGADALRHLAETNPRATPRRFFKAMVPPVREHLEAHVPPDGHRWRRPFPECLPALHYR
ncbi:hypothetical protein ACFY19_19990 [Streptosporangium saharense]|uniref:hypothetical protein n=1 Tax=Streptosporangium saharense TaxID=1706840 RepID=UPI00367D0B35